MQKAYLSSFSSRVLRGALLCITLAAMLIGARTATLAQDGQAWAWGYNGNGELGDGTGTIRAIPVKVSGITGVVQIAGGGNATLALKSDGTVWAWGYNGYGQLGDGTTTSRSTPVQVVGLTGIVQVAAGYAHSLALKSDGTVWAWGYNAYGQLGIGNSTSSSVPIQALNGVKQISAGSMHSLALKSDGTLWAWGGNFSGQLGDGTYTHRAIPIKVSGITGVVQVAGGGSYSVALKSDGSVWGWGDNSYGELGNGSSGNSAILPVQASVSGITQISAGGYHTLALKSDGAVWVWGYNGHGELGDGTTTDKNIPEMITDISGVVQLAGGIYHSVALKADGTVWAWGDNPYGQVGNGTSGGYVTTPIQVVGLAGQAYIAAGEYCSFSITAIATQKTTLKISNISFHYGTPITLSATLKNASSGAVIPNETVSFSLGGTAVGSANTDSAGVANIVVPNPPNYTVGTYTIVASFAGDFVYLPAPSKSATLTITMANTSIKVANVAGSPGVTKSLTAILKRTSDNALLSGQSLAFSVDGNAIGTATTDGTGIASLSYAFDATYNAGAHTLTAAFAGDSNHNASSGTGTLTVNKAATSVTIGAYSISPGVTKNLSATLKRKTDKTPLSGQTITFSVDGSTIGTATTDATGKAILSYTSDETYTAGSHALTAAFAGATDYSASTGTATLTVTKAPAKIVGASLSGRAGATITFLAVLTRKTDTAGINGRTVRFQVDGVDAGSAITFANGYALMNYTIPAEATKGAHAIGYYFDGDAYYSSSSDASKTLTVK